MTEQEVAEIATKCGLGQASEHIFGVWELPLKPIVTENVLEFAREIIRTSTKEFLPLEEV